MKKGIAFLLTALAVVMAAEAATNMNRVETATNVGSGPVARTEGDDTPQRVVSFVKEEHTPEWYAQQMALWRKVTEREPKNGEAWLNLYHATRYHIMFTDEQEDYTPLTAVWKTAHEAIPDSYADYVLTYFHARFVGTREMDADESAHERILRNMVKAIRMQPDKVEAYPDYVACLMMTCDEELMNDILHRWYESGTYSANLLNYAYNEMVGLEPHAIIFTNGDVDTFSKLILQGGKGLFTDTQVVCAPMLHSTRYRETICRQLGISLAGPSDTATAEDYDQWLEGAQLAIIGQTGRPAYFCATAERMPSFADKLYSEGLVSRYSPRRYDNLAVKQRNYEKRYLLDYLYETFVPETYEASAYRLNLNYIPCLKSLLDWYKQEDKTRYKELYGMMMTIIRRTENMPEEKKQSYYDEINR